MKTQKSKNNHVNNQNQVDEILALASQYSSKMSDTPEACEALLNSCLNYKPVDLKIPENKTKNEPNYKLVCESFYIDGYHDCNDDIWYNADRYHALHGKPIIKQKFDYLNFDTYEEIKEYLVRLLNNFIFSNRFDVEKIRIESRWCPNFKNIFIYDEPTKKYRLKDKKYPTSKLIEMLNYEDVDCLDITRTNKYKLFRRNKK
jgi:hypothetical protein